MVYDFIVIGATGMQGQIASRDLLENGHSVMMTGRKDKEFIKNLLKKHKNAGFSYLDLRNEKDIINTIKQSGSKIVLNCADGDFDLDIYNACVKAKVNVLDLGSDQEMSVGQFKLHNKFKKNNCVAITGCGSTPGIVSVMAGYASKKLDKIDKIHAGFAWNSNKKKFVVPYSVSTITEEFTDKANIVKDGKLAWADPFEYVLKQKFKDVGKHVSRNILHQEPYTFYRSFRNKGVKEIIYFAAFPKHSFDVFIKLIELGLGSKEKIWYNNDMIKVVDFVGEALRKIKVPEGYTEKEALWVNVYGKNKERNKMIKMLCVAKTLKGWEKDTCNIDTGMTISIMGQMLKKGEITAKGSFSPELIVPSDKFFSELARRKMYVYENGKKIN